MPEQINKQTMGQIRRAILQDPRLEEHIHTTSHTVTDPDRDEVYHTGEYYNEVSCIGEHISSGKSGADVWYGIRLRLNSKLTTTIKSILESIFQNCGHSLSEYSIEEKERVGYVEYQITNDAIIEDTEQKLANSHGVMSA